MSEVSSPFPLESSKDYTVIKEIGEGSYGRALLARDNKTTELIVVKEISFNHLSEQEQNLARDETRILSCLKCRYIVGYRGSFMENNIFHILMEYADGGDLSKKIQEAKEPFPENQILKWFVQLCLALKYCHDRKILHRDLKAENVFLTKDGDVKLGDFGIAKVLDHTTSFAKTSIGTPFYLSPEICEGKPYNVKSDIWSLGCVLYELCTLKKPFESNCINGLIIKIISKKPAPLPKCYSSNLQKLVESLLKKKPANRPTIHQILNKKFINQLVREYLTESEIKDEFSHTTFHGAKGGETPKNPSQNSRGSKVKSKLAVRKSGIPVRSKNQVSRSINCSNTNSSTKEHTTSSARSTERPKEATTAKPSTTSGIRPPSTPSRYSPSNKSGKLKTSSSPLNKPKLDPHVKSQDIIHLESNHKSSKNTNSNSNLINDANNNAEEDYDENVGNTEDYEFCDDFISDDEGNNDDEDDNTKFTFKGKPLEDDPSCPQEFKNTKLSSERNDIVRNFIIQNLGKQKFDKAYNLVAVESEGLDENQVEERLNNILVSQKELDFYPLIQQLIVAESMEDSDLDYF